MTEKIDISNSEKNKPQPIDPILQFFDQDLVVIDDVTALRGDRIAREFSRLAHSIVADDGNSLALPRCAERTVVLRKLLEARDAAIRALVAK